jgi:hypothetical protein
MTKFSIDSFLCSLFIVHALVGAWNSARMADSEHHRQLVHIRRGYLFMWTSALMFSLRFCANFIEASRHFASGHSRDLRDLACVG